MVEIDIENLILTSELKTCSGQWTRSESKLPEGMDGHVKIDELGLDRLKWMSLIHNVAGTARVSLKIRKGIPVYFNESQGLLLRTAEHSYLFPVPPRFINSDVAGRITEYMPLEWNIIYRGDSTISLSHSGKGSIELPILVFGRESEPDLMHTDGKVWAAEGCWSKVSSFRDFFHFLVLGSVYSGHFGNYGRFPSAQTALSLYKIAAVLQKRSGHRLYGSLMVEIAYSVLNDLSPDGSWKNGEWLEEMETHFRSQADGVLLMSLAYQKYGDPAFLRGAEKAASYMLDYKDVISDDGWWYLHDTLEADDTKLRGYYAAVLNTRSFGKRSSNTLALNTHINGLIALGQLARLTNDGIYLEAYANGMRAAESVLSASGGEVVHLIAEKLMDLSFECEAAPLPRRAVRHVIRKYIRSRLFAIQLYFPRFVTPGGYIWRDMALPVWGYWYHLVNLYDLLRLQRMDKQPWLEKIIRQGMKYALESQLVDFLIAQRHYIVPQWLQILELYAELYPEFNRDRLSIEVARISSIGYGLPPELEEI